MVVGAWKEQMGDGGVGRGGGGCGAVGRGSGAGVCLVVVG